MPHIPKNETVAQTSDRMISELRYLAAQLECRIELSSDQEGALGHYCVAASTPGREKQGFGSSIQEAVHNLRTQPARGSTGKP